MPGYKLCSSKQKAIEEKYYCNYCHFLLKDAMQTCCGHFYCQECLNNLYLNNQTIMTCLVDQNEFKENEVHPDTFMRREVKSFVVHCTLMDNGCSWKGAVRELADHQGECEFRVGTAFNGVGDQSKNETEESKHHVVNCSYSDKDNLMVHVSHDSRSVCQGMDIRNDTPNTPRIAPITERNGDLPQNTVPRRQFEELKRELHDEMRQLQTRISRLEEENVELRRSIDDQKMESILIWDGQTQRMKSIEHTLSSLKVNFTHQVGESTVLYNDCHSTEFKTYAN